MCSFVKYLGFNIKQFEILKHLTLFLKSSQETSVFNIDFFLAMSLCLGIFCREADVLFFFNSVSFSQRAAE